MRQHLRLIAWALLLSGIASCGGQTSDENTTSGGSAGAGNVSAGGAGGGGGMGGMPGGASGAGGTPPGGSSGCGPIDPGGACAELGETSCLAAHPRCAPVYDDFCCPSCEPGVCADCVNYRFYRCVPFEESSCTPGMIPTCGVTPQWACQAGSADCTSGAPCNFTPGCLEATVAGCAPDQMCPNECHPVSAWTCGPVCAPSPLPLCNLGVPEVGPNGYTGFCVSGEGCGVQDSCPAEPPPTGASCALPGVTCTYSGFCAPTCTCNSGVWQCLTPPC